jgi:hypothetical protein
MEILYASELMRYFRRRILFTSQSLHRVHGCGPYRWQIRCRQAGYKEQAAGHHYENRVSGTNHFLIPINQQVRT